MIYLIIFLILFLIYKYNMFFKENFIDNIYGEVPFINRNYGNSIVSINRELPFNSEIFKNTDEFWNNEFNNYYDIYTKNLYLNIKQYQKLKKYFPHTKRELILLNKKILQLYDTMINFLTYRDEETYAKINREKIKTILDNELNFLVTF
jgi:hypothetical protein